MILQNYLFLIVLGNKYTGKNAASGPEKGKVIQNKIRSSI